MGGIGFLGGAIAQPSLGAIYDAQISKAIPGNLSIDFLKSAMAGTPEGIIWEHAQLSAGANTLLYVAIIPAILIVAFGYLFIYKRKHLTR
jgi:hypothetical protein